LSLRSGVCSVFIFVVSSAALSGEPLAIQLDTVAIPARNSPILGGASVDPDGHGIGVDSRSLFLDGKPWVPVVGEFHYSRYPRDEWREELLKMKAGGINTVSTYVFWIHHEEEKGKYDWSGDRSLRDFLKTVQDIGMKAIVRIGPWAHGEVRNGGFPDWVQNSGSKLRTVDPAFLAIVKPFLEQIAAQMKGLLWKDGGPVIGVQIDNECNGTEYLLTLKRMARDAGIDVPVYTMTGWNNVEIPKEGLLPVFGGYVDGFWGGKPESYRKEFFFTKIRTLNDLGAQFVNRNPSRAELLELFPYACAEIGPGMMSSYEKRVLIDPEDVGAITVSKLGSGNNMPGYYMYQGGMNPDGRLSSLQEDHPNVMPVKDYDFQTALGACGEVREQYRILRQQHLFLGEFGARLARMTFFPPDKTPHGVGDSGTLRWAMRSDGGSGFLFLNNRQPGEPLPDHAGVQFSIRTINGPVTIPSEPITIPSGSYGIWPVGIDCHGVGLDYATVQPLCSVADGKEEAVFFSELPGVRPEIKLAGQPVRPVVPGTSPALTATNAQGATVTFVVLTPEEGRRLALLTLDGKQRAVLSKATAYEDHGELFLATDDAGEIEADVFPALEHSNSVPAGKNGIFTKLTIPRASISPPRPTITQIKPADPEILPAKVPDEASWEGAAIYKISLPKSGFKGRFRLEIDYIGDAARVYAGDRLVLDNFYNGEPFGIPLWRLSKEERDRLTLRVLPCPDSLLNRLPPAARLKIDKAKAAGNPSNVTVSIIEQRTLKQ